MHGSHAHTQKTPHSLLMQKAIDNLLKMTLTDKFCFLNLFVWATAHLAPVKNWGPGYIFGIFIETLSSSKSKLSSAVS